jgi:hypothetical protein
MSKSNKSKKSKRGNNFKNARGVVSPDRSKGTPFNLEEEVQADLFGSILNGDAWKFDCATQRGTQNSNR